MRASDLHILYWYNTGGNYSVKCSHESGSRLDEERPACSTVVCVIQNASPGGSLRSSHRIPTDYLSK